MSDQINLFIENLRSEGDGEFDLDFGVNLRQARGHFVIPGSADYGLLELSKAVEKGARDVYLEGNEHRCRLSYQGYQVTLPAGATKRLLRRGCRAPLNLWFQGHRLVNGDPKPLVRLPLKAHRQILGGFLDILPPARKGQVELVDRGVSFRLGPLFGPLRVVAYVTPQRGAPWPSSLVFDSSTEALLRELWESVRTLLNK